MTVLADFQIADHAKNSEMISPFMDRQVKLGAEGRVISSGLSSYGYDARLAPEFHIFKSGADIVDPKDMNEKDVDIITEETLVLAPGQFALAHTLEYFKMPLDCVAICMGKSTYARTGLIVNVTPLEPGWEGHVTLELSNTNTKPVRIYAYEGICQFLFFRGEKCRTNYADREGKYMGQTGVTHARV